MLIIEEEFRWATTTFGKIKDDEAMGENDWWDGQIKICNKKPVNSKKKTS